MPWLRDDGGAVVPWLRDDGLAGGAVVPWLRDDQARLRMYVSSEARHPAAITRSRGQGASFKGSQLSRDGHSPLSETFLLHEWSRHGTGEACLPWSRSPLVVYACVRCFEIP